MYIFYSSGRVTFPAVTICAAYEIAYKSDFLQERGIPVEKIRRYFEYPNVSNLTGNSLAIL